MGHSYSQGIQEEADVLEPVCRLDGGSSGHGCQKLSWQEKIKKVEHLSPLGFHSIMEKRIEMICKEMRTDLIQQNNSQQMTLKPEVMLGVLLEITHSQPRVEICAERRVIPNCTNIFEFVRGTNAALDVSLECCRDNHWNVDGGRGLSVLWTHSTSRWMHVVWEEIEESSGNIQARLSLAGSVVKYVENSQHEDTTHWTTEKPKLNNARKW